MSTPVRGKEFATRQQLLELVRACEPPVGTILAIAGDVTTEMKGLGWLPCDGRALPASQYKELAKRMRGRFGKARRGSVRLPDLRGRTVMGAGRGSGLTSRRIGDQVGTEAHELTASEMSPHEHILAAHSHLWTTKWTGSSLGWQNGGYDVTFDGNGKITPLTRESNRYTSRAADLRTERTISAHGSAKPHNNVSPAQIVTFIIKCRSAID